MKFIDLLETKMTVKLAISTLGLSNVYDQDDVKTAYKAKAKANHPDRGGSTEEMQKINTAYEVLKSSKNMGSGKFDWESSHKAYSELCKNINESIKKSFDKAYFSTYFKAIFGKPFKVNNIEYYGEAYYKGTKKPYGSPSSAGIKFIIESNDGEIVINFSATVYLTDIKGSNGLAGAADSVPLSVEATGFFAGRNFKLFKKRWGNEKVSSFNFNDVEQFFPKSKLIKHLEKKKTKATKKDFISAITKILKGENLYDDVYACPIKGDVYLMISRRTMMRKGFYYFEISDKVASRYTPNDSKINNFYSYPESPEMLDLILSLKGKSEKAIEKIIFNSRTD